MMLESRWVVLLVGLLACGLLAAGCGDDSDDDSSDAATITAPPEPPNIPEDATATVPETTTPSEVTTTSEDSTSTDIFDTEAFQRDCIGAFADATEGEAFCQQAVDSLEKACSAAAAAGDTSTCQLLARKQRELFRAQHIADQALESQQGAGG